MEKNQTQRPSDCASFSLQNKKLYEPKPNTPALQCSNTLGNSSRHSQLTLTTPKEHGFLNLIKKVSLVIIIRFVNEESTSSGSKRLETKFKVTIQPRIDTNGLE